MLVSRRALIITEKEDTQASKRIDRDEKPSLLQAVYHIPSWDLVHFDDIAYCPKDLSYSYRFRWIIVDAWQ